MSHVSRASTVTEPPKVTTRHRHSAAHRRQSGQSTGTDNRTPLGLPVDFNRCDSSAEPRPKRAAVSGCGDGGAVKKVDPVYPPAREARLTVLSP